MAIIRLFIVIGIMIFFFNINFGVHMAKDPCHKIVFDLILPKFLLALG